MAFIVSLVKKTRLLIYVSYKEGKTSFDLLSFLSFFEKISFNMSYYYYTLIGRFAMQSYLQELNKEQLEAVLHTDGPLLVLAGAGSGKTKMLVSKVSYLINEKNVPMDNILMLTFTNRAAKEMKKRIEKIIGSDTKELFAGTFHSFCMRLLRIHAHLVGINNNFNVIDQSEAEDIIMLIRGEVYPDKDSSFPKARTMHDIFSAAINKNKSIAAIIEDSASSYVNHISTIEEIWNRYCAYKKDRNYLDYDDMLVHTVQILENNEILREMLDQRFQYILTDEYQDTNYLQDKILYLLTRNVCNLTVVGDDNQAIYKFRGALVENIITFTNRYPDSERIILHENYRSSQEILDFANEVMTCASEGIPKQLHGQFSTGIKPVLSVSGSDGEEAIYVLREIKKRLSYGQNPEEIAVIVRSARHSLILESMLVKDKIKYNKYGGLRLFDKKVIKDIFAYLQVAENEHNELSWYRILQLYPGIGPKSARTIAEDMYNLGTTCLFSYMNKPYFNALCDAVDIVKSLSSKNLSEQINTLINGHYKEIVEKAIDEKQYKDKNKAAGKRAEEHKTFMNELKEAEVLEVIAQDYASTLDFISDFILDSVEPKEVKDAITITTIHSAKGLEFGTVFLMHCGEGLFYRGDYRPGYCVYVTNDSYIDMDEYRPSLDTIHDADDSEELRCFYVAITRAKRELILTYSSICGMEHRSPIHYLWITESEKYLNIHKNSFYNRIF